MTQDTIIRLKIISLSYTPEMITEAIGLPCDKWWRIGDVRKHTTIIEKNNGWILSSGLPKNAPFDAHIEAIFNTLEIAKDNIHKLSVSETVELSVVIYASSMPALYLEGATVRRLAEFGAGLDIDLYISEEYKGK